MPCVVRELTDDEMEEIALDENIQRENLNPADEGETFKRMMERRKLSLRDMATRISKSHEYVAQRLRALDNPDITQIVRAGLPLSVALSIDRCAEPARGTFIKCVLDGNPPSLSEVRAARTSQGQVTLSKVLTPHPPTPAQEPPAPGPIGEPIPPLDALPIDPASPSWDAPASKVLTPTSAPSTGATVTGVSATSPHRRGDASTQDRFSSTVRNDAPQGLSSKVLTLGPGDAYGGDSDEVRAHPATDAPRSQPMWIRAEDVRSFALLQAGDGRAEREQLLAALWADLEALGG